VKGCDLYQRMKNRAEKSAGKLKLSEVPEKPWTYLMVCNDLKLELRLQLRQSLERS